MAVARSTKESQDYVLQADRKLPVEQQTKFHLATMKTHTHVRVQGMLATAGNLTGELVWLLLKLGLTGWTGFNDEQGQPIPFTRESRKLTHASGIEIQNPATDTTLNWLTVEDAYELAGAILRASTVTVDDAGN